MDGLDKEFEELNRSWEQVDLASKERLEEMLELLGAAQQGKPQLLSLIPGKASNVLDQWKELHVTLSKFAKALDKKLKPEATQASAGLCMQAEPNEAATEPSAEGRKRSTDEILRECLVHHLYREGLFEIGDCLVREGQMPPEYGRLKEPYLRLFELLATLRAQNIEPCLQWARERRELLGDSGLRLEFELARLHYVQLLLAGQAQAALAFAQNAFPPFTGPFEPEIQTLMGCLAFAGRLETSPYTTFLHQDFLSTTVGLLSAAYCKSMKLPQEPAFSQCVKLGTLSLPKINRVMAMMKERKGIAWSQQDELPVEIELAQNLRHHSVFVCPVLKQQATAGNPPMMMPCGHVICLEALTRLSKGNNFVRFKCPYCPAESTSKDARKVYF